MALMVRLVVMTGVASSVIDEAYQAAKVFLSRRRDFTAIVAGSDMMAIGILRALHEAHATVDECGP